MKKKICEICKKEIQGEPIKSFRDTLTQTGDLEIREQKTYYYCNEQHEYIDLLLRPEHMILGIDQCVTHLIHDHCCSIDILEETMNSQLFINELIKKTKQENPFPEIFTVKHEK